VLVLLQLVLMARRLALVIISVTMHGFPQIQAVATLVVLMAALGLQLDWRPFKSSLEHFIELVAYVSNTHLWESDLQDNETSRVRRPTLASTSGSSAWA
jgi:hypothetical protein